MKKKIASSILALSLAFNMAFVNVYAEGSEVSNDTVGSDTNLGEVTEEFVTLGDDGSTVAISGLITFPENIFPTTELGSNSKVAQIKFEVDDDDYVTADVLYATANSASFSNLSIDDGTEYSVTLITDDNYTTGYSINTTYSYIQTGSPVGFTATKDSQGETIKITSTVNFEDDIFSEVSGKVAQLVFTDAYGNTVERDLNRATDSTAKPTDDFWLTEGVEYAVTLVHADNKATEGYSLSTTYTAVKDDAITFTATKDAESKKVSVSGSVTFVNAEYDDLKDYSPKLVFSADGQDTVTADLEIADTTMGYFSDIELVDGVAYNISLTGIDIYEIAKYGYDYDTVYTVNGADVSFSRDAKLIVEDDTQRKPIQVTGIVTFPEAEFNENSFDKEKNIVFTPKRGGETKSVKLEFRGTTTATYDVQLLNNKEYKVSITDVDGYTLSETITTPNDDGTQDFTATTKTVVDEDEDNKFVTDGTGNATVTTTEPGENETFGDSIKQLTGTIKNLLENIKATLNPISTSGNVNTSVSITNTIETEGSELSVDDGNQTITTTVEYDAPLVMFDLSLFKSNDEKYNGDEVEIEIEFEKIELSPIGDANSTYLKLFHFDEDGTIEIIENATFKGNETNGYTSVTFTTNNFSPFAIAQGYSTVKITQSNSDSSYSPSSSSSSSSGTVSAVGSDGTTYYITGNIPTVGFISQLRNVTVGEVVNLDKITVTGKEIIGWFYDRDFTEQVENTSVFVITQDVMDNGVYPQFKVEIGTLGANLNVSSNTTSNSYVATTVPSTGVVLGASLF